MSRKTGKSFPPYEHHQTLRLYCSVYGLCLTDFKAQFSSHWSSPLSCRRDPSDAQCARQISLQGIRFTMLWNLSPISFGITMSIAESASIFVLSVVSLSKQWFPVRTRCCCCTKRRYRFENRNRLSFLLGNTVYWNNATEKSFNWSFKVW